MSGLSTFFSLSVKYFGMSFWNEFGIGDCRLLFYKIKQWALFRQKQIIKATLKYYYIKMNEWS